MVIRKLIPDFKAAVPDLHAAKNVFEDNLSFVVTQVRPGATETMYAVILPHTLEEPWLMQARLAIAEHLTAIEGVKVLIDMVVTSRIELHIAQSLQERVASYAARGPSKGLPPALTMHIELCICRALAAQKAAPSS